MRFPEAFDGSFGQVHFGDAPSSRAGDITEALDYCDEHGLSHVTRSQHDRCCEVDSRVVKLHQSAQTWEAMGLARQIRVASQKDKPARTASEWVPPLRVDVLSTWRHDGQAMPGWSVGEFLMALGRLGGQQNRPSDGPPGWLTLWRGWAKLQPMLQGAALASRRSGGT
jgi:hypothetical protein